MRRSCLPLNALAGWLFAVSLFVPASLATAQAAGPRDLLLEVVVNGVDTEKVGAFQEKDGRLFATAEELRALGFATPTATADDALVDLAEIVSVPAIVDELAQTIALTVPVRGLAVHRVTGDLGREQVRTSSSPMGVLLNYDITATAHEGTFDAYGYGSARVFGGSGTFQNDFIVGHSRTGFHAVRLASTYAYSDPKRSRTYSAGDVISGALPYTHPLRLGGVQVSTDFALRPDLITYPVPIITGGATVPSTLDVFVNGVRQLSTSVEAGPFAVPQLPIVTGAGQVSVAVRDITGRSVVQTSSFYVSQTLLKPGLWAYSFEAGAIRKGYGAESFAYGRPAAFGTLRRGITPGLTVEGHAETFGGLALVTGGATIGIGRFAVASVALGGSRSSAGTGWQSYVAIERTTRQYHFGASASLPSKHFRDLGLIADDLSAGRTVQVNAGLVLGRQGSFNVAFTDVVQRPIRPAFVSGVATVIDPGRASIVSGTYSRDVFGRAYLYVTAYDNLCIHDRAISVGVTLRLGGQRTISGSFESASRQAVVEASDPAVAPGDIGWHVYGGHGASDRLLGEMSYRGSVAQVGVGIDRSGRSTALQATAQGSVVLLGGSVYAAPTISDGFALIDTQGFSNVAVMVNNRPAGHTGRNGKLLVPGLVSYQPNAISIDPGDLPLDTHWDRLDTQVAPNARSGVVARFGIRRQHELLLTLRLESGAFVPPGASIVVDDGAVVTTSGFDGQVYFPDLPGQHRLTATLPDDTRCDASFPPSGGDDLGGEVGVLCRRHPTTP
ncbi:fimbria/pilus outer membrane usher protein [Sphingomonas echinoides]|uniref:fimbria/pilus outer membrane usher protein n=1 Tax=Sphingomonas echinoides TaxID=59803 RepID=UPI002412F0C1|nr:fimbria/pilus outer membrane usher protein [Sphingomonas echinoides]